MHSPNDEQSLRTTSLTEVSWKGISRSPLVEQTSPLANGVRIFLFYVLRHSLSVFLAIPLINETLHAFITFMVPLWIRLKSFETVPHALCNLHCPEIKRKKKIQKQKVTLDRFCEISLNDDEPSGERPNERLVKNRNPPLNR